MNAFKVLLFLCVASFCECREIPNVGIYGGWNITIQEAPYMAQVRYDREVVCSGSIVDNQYILTAAECLPSSRETKGVDVLLDTELENREDRGKRFFAEAIICHPNYSSTTKEFSACLIKLSQSINISKLKMVALDNNRQDKPIGTKLYVAGWGMIKRGDQETLESETLTQVALEVIDRDSCQQAYDAAGDKHIKITANMICAADKGKGACYGDGGGPLTNKRNGYYIQYGIVFYNSRDCGNSPTVFTKVSSIRDWARSVIRK